LKEHLRQAEQYGEGGVKYLQNGRIRYYSKLRPAKDPLSANAGQRTVREWDPMQNLKRTWMETVDKSDRVKIVRATAT
jgi:hypothetical protein